jgi:iron-sulfur cluster assembly accessory protein
MGVGENAVAAAGSGAPPLLLRIRVDGGGCSGFKYSFLLERAEPATDGEDRVFGRDGAVVAVDAGSLELIRGSTLDYEEDLMRASFAIVNNPNSESSCGCGSSFSAKA